MIDSGLFLYKIQPVRAEMLSGTPTPEEENAVARHFAYLKQLTAEGVVVLAGRTLNTDSSSFGIVVFRAASEQEARQVMHRDPAVQERVMRAELYPFRMALVGKITSLVG